MAETGTFVTDRYADLSQADLDTVYALHLKATGAVGRPDLIKPESRDFFARILAGGGRMTGVFRHGVLIAYGVLQVDLPPSEDARPMLGLNAGDSLAKLAGASVLPDAWGAGLHDVLIDIRIDQARRMDVQHLYSTAAPGNARSWENLLTAGFAVRAVIEKYGGHARYVLHRDLSAGEVSEGEGLWCAADDVERQRLLTAEGRAGSRWRRHENGLREIWYGRAP